MNVILEQRFRASVKAIMERDHISQSELARRIGVTPSMVNQYLSGRISPGFGVVERFATALGVQEPNDLLADPEKLLAIT